jgi:hypothetical protein
MPSVNCGVKCSIVTFPLVGHHLAIAYEEEKEEGCIINAYSRMNLVHSVMMICGRRGRAGAQGDKQNSYRQFWKTRYRYNMWLIICTLHCYCFEIHSCLKSLYRYRKKILHLLPCIYGRPHCMKSAYSSCIARPLSLYLSLSVYLCNNFFLVFKTLNAAVNSSGAATKLKSRPTNHTERVK